jgi:predicted ATPase/DNA-binding XRE family transcriptional regulator
MATQRLSFQVNQRAPSVNTREQAQQSFGQWLRQRRRALDLTQEEFARLVGCSAVTLRKLEAETRRPSKQIAERLAEVLHIAHEDRPAFLRFARGDPFAGSEVAATPPGRLPSAQGRRPNHPNSLNSFIGRETERGEIKRLVRTARLVTLTGLGGTGKTRLALEVARELVEQFPDGVWLAELAPLSDPGLVPQTVAVVFGLKEEATQSLLDTLINALRERQLLLVLDSCEHLVTASAGLVEDLLQTCPALRILSTSREALGVPGEQPFYVPSLSIPDRSARLPVEALQSYEAVRLFIERAASVSPQFALTSENASAVTEVCQRLDGIPLAIELAAARLRLLAVEQIAERLDDSFRLLAGGNRTALPRHQTLQALFDWSYELLSVAEQSLLRRLAVFPCGWTLEGAEAVGAGQEVPPGEVFGLLARLIDKSLVFVEAHGELRRYRQLETVRQYALAKLAASGEADAARLRQAAFYLDLIEANEAAQPTTLPVRSGGLRGLELEIDNLRAALAWCQSAVGGAELGLRLASALDWFWFSRGYWSEAQGWLQGALQHPQAARYPRALAQALESLGTILVLRGDYESGQDQLARSLRLFRELNERPMVAWLLNRLGWAAREHGDRATARQSLEESLALYRELKDELGSAWSALTLGDVADTAAEAAWARPLLEESLARFEQRGVRLGAAWARNHLGHIAQLEGDFARAAQMHASSLPEFQQMGESLGVGWAHHGLGETALAQGEAGQATAQFVEGLGLFQELGDRAGMAWCLAGVAGASAAAEPAQAAWLWGAAEALRLSIGAREGPISGATRERLMAQAREQLGEAAFAESWAAGRSATAEQAIARVSQFPRMVT